MQAMPSSIPPSTLARLLLTDPEVADAGEAFYLLGRSSDAELAERYQLVNVNPRDTATSASSSSAVSTVAGAVPFPGDPPPGATMSSISISDSAGRGPSAAAGRICS